MDKVSQRKIKTPRTAGRRRAQEASSSTAQESVVPAHPRTPRRARGPLNPARQTPRRSQALQQPEPQASSEADPRVQTLKRTIRDDGEGPSTRKRRAVEQEMASTSAADTGREGDASRAGTKRKADDDEEEESIKRKKSHELKPKAKFHATYKQQKQLGEGGCGAVFAGYRRADRLPVAIKHIPKSNVCCTHVDEHGNRMSIEVAVMRKLAAEASGGSTSISLLDWFDLGHELILVLERPMPAMDLFTYLQVKGGAVSEAEAKFILRQLLDAVIELEDKKIFHRDIKVENILIETGSAFPRVWLIDFGLSCFVKKGSSYSIFYGTSAHTPPEWYMFGKYRAGPTTVWQLGVVLFELLHRKSTFVTTSFLERKLKISKSLPEDSYDFLQKCLARKPEKRATLEQLQNHPWLR